MSDTPTTPRVYTYARVSKDDAATGSCSLVWQLEQCKAWTARQDKLVYDHQYDNGVSGFTRLENRPYGRVITKMAINAGDVVLVAKLDRIFRNVEDFRRNLRKWRHAGVRLVSATEPMDLETPQGRLMATIIVAFAECERDTIQARLLAAHATRREHGLRQSTEPRYGWKHVAFGPKRPDGSQEHRVEVDAKEQRAIQVIVAAWGRCKGVNEICRELDRLKIPTRRGGKWSHAMVRKILTHLDAHIDPDKKSPAIINTNRNDDYQENYTGSDY